VSTPGNRDGNQRDTGGDPTEMMPAGPSGSGSTSAGAAEDDATEEYVPGMYAGNSADETDTRAHTAPIPASRAADAHRSQDTRTKAQPQAAPVTATRTHTPDVDRGERDRGHQATPGTAVSSPLPSLEDRKLLHQREKEHFGGMRFGSAFFGWLTATGLFVILTAVAGAVAALFGYGSNLSTADLTTGSAELQATGITAAVVLGVILLISYYAGGYVAGRMARFSGLKQGVAVWLWALIVAVVLTIIGLIAGNRINVSDQFGGIGVPAVQDFTGPGLIGLLIVAAIALVGAVLGGLAGMRYHRRIDRMDFDAVEER
jgi:hypothetical protein